MVNADVCRPSGWPFNSIYKGVLAVEFIHQYKSWIATNVIGNSTRNDQNYSTCTGHVYKCFKSVIHTPATNTDKRFCLISVNYENWSYWNKISSSSSSITTTTTILSWPFAWNTSIIAVRRAAPDTGTFGRTARQISKSAASNTCDCDRRQAGTCQIHLSGRFKLS